MSTSWSVTAAGSPQKAAAEILAPVLEAGLPTTGAET
jgi:hypothetical protein